MVELILNNLYSAKYTESLYKLRLQQPSCEDLLSIYLTIFSFCQKNDSEVSEESVCVCVCTHKDYKVWLLTGV